MLFWILAAAMTAMAALVLLRPLLRASADPGGSDLAVYRDQLAELERDVARGLIDPADAAATRTEIARRLLAADARGTARTVGAPASANRLAVAGILALLLGGGGWIYASLGAPGQPDMPLADRTFGDDRPTQDQLEADAAEANAAEVLALDAEGADLLRQLRDALADRPDDEVGHTLLARNLARQRDYAGAWRAQARVVEIKGDTATGEDITSVAEWMIFAARGFISPEAEAVLTTALQADPSNRRARYYSGAALAQAGQSELALQLWTTLLNEGPADAPWKDAIRAQVRSLAAAAGLPTPDSALLPGPTAEDVEAASEMTAEDRAEMIRGMVEGLAERLATEGGSADEWARLIRALGVLGEADRAAMIAAEARTVFADDPQALATIAAAEAPPPQ